MNRRNEFDRIREKTGIDRLEPTQRKRLFEEFIQHGGTVLQQEGSPKKDELGTRGPLLRDQRKTKDAQQTAAQRKTEGSRAFHGTAREGKSSKKNKKKHVRVGDLIKIYARGLTLKVFTFSGNRFSEKFINYFHKDVKESFIDLVISMDSFLKGDGSIRRDIYRLSIGENSTFFEFMLRMSVLTSDRELGEIAKVIAGGTIPRGTHTSLFKGLFLRLYVLGQFTDLCKLYIDKSLQIQSVHRKINPVLIPSIRAQLRKDINIIFGDFLLKLHIVLCKMDRTFYPMYSQKLDDFLGITEKDKVGYITREERKKRLTELKMQREYLKRQHAEIHEKEKLDVKIPKHVERGIPLLNECARRYGAIHQEDVNNPLPLMRNDDKMYKAFIYLDVFDNEYSFILTTGKISFNIDYREQKKIDTKEDLGHAYLLLSEAREEVKDYIEIVREIKKTQDNMRLTIHQKSDMVDSLLRKQSVVSKASRLKISDAMKAVESALSVVISDYNSSKRLLQNPDQALFFDKSIDGDKKLHGKKTIEAIVEAFLVASAFAFFLNFGELSGSGLFVEEKPVPSHAPGNETESSRLRHPL